MTPDERHNLGNRMTNIRPGIITDVLQEMDEPDCAALLRIVQRCEMAAEMQRYDADFIGHLVRRSRAARED